MDRLLVLDKEPQEEWASYYLNYDDLINHLKSVKNEWGMRRAVSTRTIAGETRTFAEILDSEVEKVVLFFLRKQGALAKNLMELRHAQRLALRGDLSSLGLEVPTPSSSSSSSSSSSELTVLTNQPLTIAIVDQFLAKYRDLGNEMITLLEYLRINTVGLRKILRKHDKHFDIKMSAFYFENRLSSSAKHSQLLQLYHQEGLKAIHCTLRRGLEDLYDARTSLEMFHALDDIDIKIGMGGRDSLLSYQEKRSSLAENSVRFIRSPSIGYGVNNMNMKDTWDEDNQVIPISSYASNLALEEGRSSMSMKMQIQTQMESNTTNSNLSQLAQASTRGSSTATATASSGTSSYGSIEKRDDNGYKNTMNRSLSDLEPILKAITDATDRVSRSQERTFSDYNATYSEIGLENLIRDAQRKHAAKDDLDLESDDSDSDEDEEDEVSLNTKSSFGCTSQDDKGRMIDRKDSRGRTAIGEEQPLLTIDTDISRKNIKSTPVSFSPSSKSTLVVRPVGLLINLGITFLYMMNMYIVAPTSGKYAAILGGSEEMSSIIIGLSPLAALVSAIIYSEISNASFRSPILAGCLLCVVGNLYYAIALQCQSPWMLVIGRFMVGLGAIRGVTRRYIADTVPIKRRTMAANDFVNSGAMGLVAGPLCSTIITIYITKPYILTFNNVVYINFQAVTAPGWIMFTLWSIASVAAFMLFKEPSRKILERSKRGTNNTPTRWRKTRSFLQSRGYGSVGDVSFSFGIIMIFYTLHYNTLHYTYTYTKLTLSSSRCSFHFSNLSTNIGRSTTCSEHLFKFDYL